MKSPIRNLSLSQQLALVAATLCLVVSLALVLLGAISSRHMQLQLQQEYGEAMARLIARSVSPALENGDLLSVAASLQRFEAAAQQVVVTDVEGRELGQAGSAPGANFRRFSAPVHIGNTTAGRVTVTLSTHNAQAALWSFVSSLLGLAILLSVAVYGGTRHFGQHLGNRLATLARTIRLDEADAPAGGNDNELERLSREIEALPMDLLRSRSEPIPRDENYRTTAVLYVHLASLSNYVLTLNEQALQNYTNRLHQVIYAAAGFYAGDLQVARQFGLAVYFTDANKAGSAAFRAASCAWLVRAVCGELEQHMSLSMTIAMAISQSELGIGDGADIYPGLYMQHTLDELQAVCAAGEPALLLSPAAREDMDIASRLRHAAVAEGEYAAVVEFAGGFRDLLERQLRLIVRRLTEPAPGG